MNATESLATDIANAMSAAGYEISDQLYNALETEFTAVLEDDPEEGDYSSLDVLLRALEYAANRVYIIYNDQ